jgi:hypothetical protein
MDQLFSWRQSRYELETAMEGQGVIKARSTTESFCLNHQQHKAYIYQIKKIIRGNRFSLLLFKSAVRSGTKRILSVFSLKYKYTNTGKIAKNKTYS